ncbi:MAG: dipicolinate synthase subunit B [Oscillospiraceae bacterium]|nr:dipicolinate synthase subunit B [Oscillospiraceae bacterium]
MKEKNIGFALCGSFCTLHRAVDQLRSLIAAGYPVLPVMSETAYSTDTRFGRASDWVKTVETLCGRPVIHTVVDAEPIGPKRLVDVMVVCPCTGNTAAKLANGITDTPVTMAVKSSLRNQIPVLLTMATNDALSGSAQNIGKLMNTRNIYFTPMGQDDCNKKPTSVIADFTQVLPAMEAALYGEQLQPLWV